VRAPTRQRRALFLRFRATPEQVSLKNWVLGGKILRSLETHRARFLKLRGFSPNCAAAALLVQPTDGRNLKFQRSCKCRQKWIAEFHPETPGGRARGSPRRSARKQEPSDCNRGLGKSRRIHSSLPFVAVRAAHHAASPPCELKVTSQRPRRQAIRAAFRADFPAFTPPRHPREPVVHTPAPSVRY